MSLPTEPEWLDGLLARLGRFLSPQAPLKDFAHLNLLQGFLGLHFRDALAAAESITGNYGYQSQAAFRAYFAQGRIDSSDLNAALDETPELRADATAAGDISRRDVLLAGLRIDLQPLPPSALRWRIEADGALDDFQADVSEEARLCLLKSGDRKAQILADLWLACQRVLGYVWDPEQRVPAPAGDGEDEAARLWAAHRLKHEAAQTLAELMEQAGSGLTLRGLLQKLTGRDVLDALRPGLVRHLAAHLDLGMAAWHNPARDQGLYAAWRWFVHNEPRFKLTELSGYEPVLERLPDDARTCIKQEMDLLGLPEAQWESYLENLAKELPGWSGMVLWRHLHPGYEGVSAPVDLADYLAVRLVLERLYAQHLVGAHFKCEASLPALRGYFRHHPAELQVRLSLYAGDLPEWLEEQGHRLVREAANRAEEETDSDWYAVARLIDHWFARPECTDAGHRCAARLWPLFLLCQHLGIPAATLNQLGHIGAADLMQCLESLTPQVAGWVWLQAYERHYREQIFSALSANKNRGAWKTRPQAPAAQLMFCMDDREEGLRRHLEEIAPEVETFGAAAHFNVPHASRGIDDTEAVALCPVVPTVVVAAHEVSEQACDVGKLDSHVRRRKLRLYWKRKLVLGTRMGLLSPVLVSAAAPFALLTLAGKAFAPRVFGRMTRQLRARFDIPLNTRIAFTLPNDTPAARLGERNPGFTDAEQADRVQTLLTSTGLTHRFAPLVVIAGHGSHSENNPHITAYNCGACAGRWSGPNARLVAGMANRLAVRAILRERGIEIPDDTWFIGAEHDTCNDVIRWFDEASAPDDKRAELVSLQKTVDEATRLHAQERCRRFLSAPIDLAPEAALRHVAGRAGDYSQPRAELGHATNASAFIGRRSLSRGAFFDRRAFLISYDPTQDPGGEILERHLLTNGAVGAGINLDYYFSCANNERYGSSSKVTQNVTGLFGVMEGASSDLRTGLPQQAIEIHEAMRLLAVVEQKTEVLTAIYMRQPPLQELVGNGWVQLAAIDPDTAEIHRFVPDKGWVKWQPGAMALPTVARSQAWTLGKREALPPALIATGEVA